ncbi:MAG: transposase domain-containing protein, partial [Prevotella sp.]|nr:transposase domain-containing protein [Prevotella sp.]MBO5186512.1 transposase domain-containing protein [Prevotella sp.]
VIGRKNWLFCNTPSGADSSAVIYSLIESAKANGLDPYAYMEYVFEMLRTGCKVSRLLPWNVKI